jgi:PAS domain S-box-containing protein
MLLVIVFSLLSIGEITWIIAIYESKIELENQIVKDAEEKNQMMIQRIDNYISERVVNMLNVGDDNQILQSAISSNAEFQNMTNPRQYIEEQNVAWSSASPGTITPIMDKVIQNPAADRLRQAMNMEKSVFHDSVFGSFLVANSFGADVAGNIKPANYDQFTTPGFIGAKQNGLYIGNVDFDNSSGLISIPISVRINDNNGNFLGVVQGEVAVNVVINAIASQMESGNTQPEGYELLNDKGTVLYSSDLMEKPFAFSYPADFMQNLKGHSGYFTYQLPDNNNPYFITYASSNSSKITPTSGWILVTEYDPTQILAPVTEITNQLTLRLGIIAPIMTISAILIAHRIIKPIKNVVLATSEFSKGGTIHLEPSGTDETKELASNFNQMMEVITNSQKQIKEYGDKYRYLFEASPNPVAIIDKNLKIILINNEFERLSGYSHEELIGKPVSELVAEKSMEEFFKIYNSIQAGKEINIKDQLFWSKRKDGTISPNLINAITIYNADNSVGYMLTSRDQTEVIEKQKKIEEEAEQIRKHLEHIAIMDKQKDSFLSMISHELTTLLFPIKFCVEMLKDPKIFGQLNKDQLNAINDIYQNSVRLERLIGDYLDVQKLEIGQMNFARTNFELDQFMSKVMEHNYPLMMSKSIEFINSTEDKISLSSDPDRLHQVFTNLISNSVDFVPEKTGRIEIGARVQENGVLFYVKDNGGGIPKDKQSGLFKKFYQVDTSLTRKHNGNGLGLNICKGIVEGLGGKIWLESTFGLGTIVYFTISKGDSK